MTGFLSSGRPSASSTIGSDRPKSGPPSRAWISGVVEVDAGQGFAQPAFSKGMPIAVSAARENGIALLKVSHAHTCTSLGYFTEQIAANGLIGIGFTNASAIVSGPGGKTPVLGTNPIAITVPGDNAPLMHADFSTAAVALGKITMAKAAGETIPLGWAVDEDGNPTTDPSAALGGSLVGAAGYKGWALGLLVEFLAAGLGGTRLSLETKAIKLPEGPSHDLTQTYILIDPDTDQSGLQNVSDRLAEALASDPEVRIPGARRRTSQEPEINDALWEKVTALAG